MMIHAFTNKHNRCSNESLFIGVHSYFLFWKSVMELMNGIWKDIKWSLHQFWRVSVDASTWRLRSPTVASFLACAYCVFSPIPWRAKPWHEAYILTISWDIGISTFIRFVKFYCLIYGSLLGEELNIIIEDWDLALKDWHLRCLRLKTHYTEFHASLYTVTHPLSQR